MTVQMRKALDLQPAIDWLLSATGLAPRLTVAIGPDGLTWVDDGKSKIAIAVPSRAKRYRHGIERRCRKLTDRYLGSGQVTISPGDSIINVGANVGEVTMTLARRGASVIAMDCDGKVLPCLRANTRGMVVKILPFAAWKQDGPLSIYVATDLADTSAFTVSNETTVVEARSVDTVADEAGLDRVHLLVGDAEGAEPEVLIGARRTLPRTSFVSLACGFERAGESTQEQCAEMLLSAGFAIVRRDRHGACVLIGRNKALTGPK
jgi:FkbM family methyltransferase